MCDIVLNYYPTSAKDDLGCSPDVSISAPAFLVISAPYAYGGVHSNGFSSDGVGEGGTWLLPMAELDGGRSTSLRPPIPVTSPVKPVGLVEGVSSRRAERVSREIEFAQCHALNPQD